jgi:hypothetical protein
MKHQQGLLHSHQEHHRHRLVLPTHRLRLHLRHRQEKTRLSRFGLDWMGRLFHLIRLFLRRLEHPRHRHHPHRMKTQMEHARSFLRLA